MFLTTIAIIFLGQFVSGLKEGQGEFSSTDLSKYTGVILDFLVKKSQNYNFVLMQDNFSMTRWKVSELCICQMVKFT